MPCFRVMSPIRGPNLAYAKCWRKLDTWPAIPRSLVAGVMQFKISAPWLALRLFFSDPGFREIVHHLTDLHKASRTRKRTVYVCRPKLIIGFVCRYFVTHRSLTSLVKCEWLEPKGNRGTYSGILLDRDIVPVTLHIMVCCHNDVFRALGPIFPLWCSWLVS